jgi:hypothetical protein
MLKSYARLLVLAPMLLAITLTVGLRSNQQSAPDRWDAESLANTSTHTMVLTVTGCPTKTSTPTGTPGGPSPIPILLEYPLDCALMPQPVLPEEWYFKWSTCATCENSIIMVEGIKTISADTGLSQEFKYITDTYLPEDALGPWDWHVKVCDQSACEYSGSRTFWVRSATVTPTPGFQLYLPDLMQSAP